MHINLEDIEFLDDFYDDEELAKNKDNDDNFYFFDATIFMTGHCDIFAYSLKEKYRDYQIYTITRNNFTHYFCTKNGKYVDVRGVFNSIKDGLKSISYYENIKNPEEFIELLNDYKIDDNEIWKNTLLNFANEIIKSNEPLHLIL